MRKPTHVNILGVEIPLATIRYATWDAPVYATIGEYHTYYSESSPDIAEALLEYEKNETVFKGMANRKLIPMNMGVNRQFFKYV